MILRPLLIPGRVALPEVTATELDQLVSQIGEEILARLGRLPAASPSGGGCSTCAGLCVQTCEESARRVIAAGAERVSAAQGITAVSREIAGLIDHTLLKPEATRDDILRLCREARQWGFASVCVNPCWVSLAVGELAGSQVKVCSVAGFPLGATTTACKVAEAAGALRAGAREIDMVINIGALRSCDYDAVRVDIAEVVRVCREAGALLKAIIETAVLDDAQKAKACTLAKAAGADFVKTSTGFGPGGATARDVALMRQVVGPGMGVKAAGGIRTYEELKQMTEAGATRIGASASVKIVQSAGA